MFLAISAIVAIVSLRSTDLAAGSADTYIIDRINRIS